MSADASARNPASNTLIVIGSSAGGIEALSTLVRSLPADLPAPIVIAQHLDPDRPSHLGEILARQSALPVRSVEDREDLTPGTIFVVPSNHHVAITDHEVSVHTDATRRPVPSVDLLLATAASVFGERLIAVILTGAGSDGAAGAHAVKEAGGTVIIQDPDTAAFPSMPRSLAPSLVDSVAPVEEIGSLLDDLLKGPPVPEQITKDHDLATLLDRLRDRHGIDFSAYKPPTIMRRLRRRLAASGVTTTAEYAGYLEKHPEEEQRLVADFLIKVTRFFRDPALFARLRESVLPELIAGAQAEGRELRFWSAGCATGEEAYSLGLLVADALAGSQRQLPVRIFATDVDEAALAFARRGIYPATALQDVPPDLLDRYFTERDGDVEVSKPVRGMIVFGHHDLARRPPFPETDLVFCRNVLIYFTTELQRRALDVFAYSLRDDGVLVLGKSETAAPASNGFTPIDRRLRIYRRQGPRPRLPAARLPVLANSRPSTHEPAPHARSSMESALQRAERDTHDARVAGERSEYVFRQLPFGVAQVDRHYDLESINGAARELLGIHGLALGQDLIHLAQRIPSTALRAGIDAVLHGDPSWRLDTVMTTETATGETRHLTIACHPGRKNFEDIVESAIVVISDVTSAVTTEHEATAAAAHAASEMAALHESVERLAAANRQLLNANRELTDTVDHLREQGDEHRLAAAAAQVSSEEIETLNEELQSSNEELETLHEETQATVEELSVANDELQARTSELEEQVTLRAEEQARLAAVLDGMGDAVLVVDRHGRVVRTNAPYDALVSEAGTSFVPADDQGRPLADGATPRSRAASGEAFRLDFTTQGADGNRRWFEAIGRPMPEEDANVLVIREITDRNVRHLQEEFLERAAHELRSPLSALQGYIQLAQRRIGDDGDARLAGYLTMAVEQVRRQAALITELVDAARLQTGQLVLQRTPLDLVALTEHVVDVTRVLTRGQAIAIDASEEPLMIEGDAGRLEQVILNLLTNAITYAPDTAQIDVRLRRQDDTAELIVQDYGPGIPAEALDAIFERFAQIDPSSQSGNAGLGLGLSISKEIVEAHGGAIAAHSPPGEGATFAVHLPLLAAVASHAPV